MENIIEIKLGFARKSHVMCIMSYHISFEVVQSDSAISTFSKCNHTVFSSTPLCFDILHSGSSLGKSFLTLKPILFLPH